MCTACAKLVCYEHMFTELVSNVLLGKIWFKKSTNSTTGVLAVKTSKILPHVYEFNKSIWNKIFLNNTYFIYEKGDIFL